MHMGCVGWEEKKDTITISGPMTTTVLLSLLSTPSNILPPLLLFWLPRFF